MSDWGWVTFAYVAVYGTLVGYVVVLRARTRRVRRASDPT